MEFKVAWTGSSKAKTGAAEAVIEAVSSSKGHIVMAAAAKIENMPAAF